jgi:hypothetical protein
VNYAINAVCHLQIWGVIEKLENIVVLAPTPSQDADPAAWVMIRQEVSAQTLKKTSHKLYPITLFVI